MTNPFTWTRLRSKMKKFKSSSAMLSSLDDWSLLKLLDQVPLTDLIRLGQVNHRFNQLVKRNCRQSVRRHLVLVIGDERTSSSDDHLNTITLKQLSRTAVEGILALLPGTISLKIIYHSKLVDELIYLLEDWVEQLVVLELVLTEEIDSAIALHPLFCLFNRMTQLRELHFKYPHYCIIWPATIHLPIISQLQAFTFKVRHGAPLALEQLRLYGTNSNTLTEIKLKGFFLNYDAIDQLLDLPPHLAFAFKQLYLNDDIITLDELNTLCRMYPNLNKLGVHLRLNAIIKLNPALRMLPKLTHLTLNADFSILFGFERVESVDSGQLVPLPTVTSLSLQLVLHKHDDLDLLHLGVVFPNLVKLNFDEIFCSLCGLFSTTDVLMEHMEHFQAKGKFGELLPKLRSVIFCNQILPKKVWKPSPPKTFVNRAVSFLRRVPKRLRSLAQKTFRRVGLLCSDDDY